MPQSHSPIIHPRLVPPSMPPTIPHLLLLSSASFATSHLIILLLALFAPCCRAFPYTSVSLAPPPEIHSPPPVVAYVETSPTSCKNWELCGDNNVSYPFWISHDDATINKPQLHCGYDGLRLFCQNNQSLILRLKDDSYTVTHIDYATHTLSLADSDVLGKHCPRVRHNLTFYDQSRFGYDAEQDTNLTFFFNCTSVDVPLPYNEIGCLPRFGTKRSYVFSVDSPDYDKFLKSAACDDVVVAPVLLEQLPSNENNITKLFDPALQQGFKLNWTGMPSDQCAMCERSGGRCGTNQTTNTNLAFICFCWDGVMDYPNCETMHKGSKKRMLIVITALLAVLGSLSLLCLLLFLCLKRHKKTHGKHTHSHRVEALLKEHASLRPKRYKYSEVKKMTQSFSNKLGQGGYGTVYKGALPDGRLVAVKILLGDGGDGEEFINEVASISRTCHVNIVNLLGFCIEGSKRALVYDFMPNGSLEKYISSGHEEEAKILGPSLGWEQLHHIAVGIARGLEYLHLGCNTKIVHLDIKPHNILLDQDFCPKIADFGLAKLGRAKESKISMMGARGTVGYIAPEVFSRNFGSVTSRSDVYSYGMMVLEMVGAKRRIGNIESSSEVYFPHCIYDNFDEYCNIENSAMQFAERNKEMVRRMIIVGLWCIQLMPANRPAMSVVVNMLQGNEDLELPPRP